jgi:hypothetical protein
MIAHSEEALLRAEHFGQYGWQAYADPHLMKPKDGTSEADEPTQAEPSEEAG